MSFLLLAVDAPRPTTSSLDVANLISAVAQLLWPVAVLFFIYCFRKQIAALLGKGSEVSLKLLGNEFVVRPAQVKRPADDGAPTGQSDALSAIPDQEVLPADYVYVTHISFLRESKQAEFQKRTGVNARHYDIRVTTDSYYEGALERIDRVEYFLHEAYPEPIRLRRNREEKFLLKELANGEYVLLAKVYLKDRQAPLILQRYISLYDEKRPQ
jgi:hypothetical protein